MTFGGERVLVIGAGQIGLAVAHALHGAGTYRFALHCRTEAGAQRAVSYAQARGITIDTLGCGNLATQDTDLVVNGDTLRKAQPAQGSLSPLDSPDPDSSFVEALVEYVGPHAVIDATNMATVLAAADLRIDLATNALVRYTVNLGLAAHRAGAPMVKVTTTALGGMGLDIPFTHGDHASQGLSARMWGKLLLSGAQLQVLWTLARTYPTPGVHAVVPAACVGFTDEVVLWTVPSVQVSEADGVRRVVVEPRGADVAVVSARAGEGPTYSRSELLVLANKSVMGAITKEEVASAIMDVLAGDLSADAITALQASALHPTNLGQRALEDTALWLAARETALGHATSGTGNLGQHVTKLMFELACMRTAFGPAWLGRMLASRLETIDYVLEAAVSRAKPLLAQITAQGFEIVDDRGAWLVDSIQQRPPPQVDLRRSRHEGWQQLFLALQERGQVDSASEPEVAEVLAAVLADPEARHQLRTAMVGDSPANR